jgi:hypothetical protein
MQESLSGNGVGEVSEGRGGFPKRDSYGRSLLSVDGWAVDSAPR